MSQVRGVVVDFDEHRGDGVLRTDDGTSLYFHCVEIADGSRNIPVGERVSARRGPGRRGLDEAYEVTRDLGE